MVTDEKVKVLALVDEEGDWGMCRQEVYDGERQLFRVHDLTDCPEDAIIGRDLFDAYDWLRAVRYGMELAKQGYTSVGFEVE